MKDLQVGDKVSVYFSTKEDHENFGTAPGDRGTVVAIDCAGMAGCTSIKLTKTGRTILADRPELRVVTPKKTRSTLKVTCEGFDEFSLYDVTAWVSARTRGLQLPLKTYQITYSPADPRWTRPSKICSQSVDTGNGYEVSVGKKRYDFNYSEAQDLYILLREVLDIGSDQRVKVTKIS